MKCARCGGALERQVDPMDLHGEPEYICLCCGRSAGVTLRVGDLLEPLPEHPRAHYVRTCQHCGKEFLISTKDRKTRKFCGYDCAYAGRSLNPRQGARV